MTASNRIYIRPDTVAARITVRMWSRHRTIPRAEVEQVLGEVPDQFSGRVLIASHGVLDAVESALRKARLEALALCVPVPSIRLHLARKGMLEKIADIVRSTNQQVLEKLEQLDDDEWQAMIERSRQPIEQGGLGPFFRPQWYPSRTELANHYGLQYVSAPLSVESDEMQRLALEARQALRSIFAKVVEASVQRLRGERIRASALDKLSEFIGGFISRDIVGDDELAQLVEQARSICAGLDIKSASADMRETAAENLEAIGQSIRALLESGPERSFSED